MRVQSFIRQGHELKRVEVELSLLPGLPQISFLGLPDAALKESILRIRSAIRAQGFQLPQAHQIIVQLWPTHLKKSSRGLDLAVAAALLFETGQLEADTALRTATYYGELSLKGDVTQPEDLEEVPIDLAKGLITGMNQRALRFDTGQIAELKDLACVQKFAAGAVTMAYRRPSCQTLSFARPAAELAEVIAAGELSALFAGPPGSGKSTLIEAIPAWLEDPSPHQFQLTERLWRQMGHTLDWRPVVQPHHSTTALAMTGGGAMLWTGEIARAHGGVLILDELLEFNPKVQDALREPVESGVLTIARSGRVRKHPAQILLLATTNLCKCGWFIPSREESRCRCSRKQRGYGMARLSGPFLDRFALLALTDKWLKTSEFVSSEFILGRVSRAIGFRRRERKQNQPNGKIDAAVFEQSLSEFQRRHLLEYGPVSRRRRAALLRTARTLADLECRDEVAREDLERAARLCLQNHRLIEEWRD